MTLAIRNYINNGEKAVVVGGGVVMGNAPSKVNKKRLAVALATKSIKLTREDVLQGGLVTVGGLLARNALVKLDLSRSRLVDEQVVVVCDLLRQTKNVSLTTLNLAWSQIGDTPATH